MKQTLLNNLKNIFGWKTKRKIVVFSVDDFGNVRLDSKNALENMSRAGLKVRNRFDAFDALETREDLEMLYEVLTCVKDKNGNNAVFTPFALPCNIDFEEMAKEKFSRYIYELLPQTYTKLASNDSPAYDGTWNLWREGIQKGLMAPQFHGREHFNVKVFNEKLSQNDPEVIIALNNRSFSSISSSGYPSIGVTAAFSFHEPKEVCTFPEIIETGLKDFHKVYGYPATVFTPPAQQFHISMEKPLLANGIKYIDKPFYSKRHLGLGKYEKRFNFTGRKNRGYTALVRNVVFEPSDKKSFDWVTYTIKQIEAAFLWNSPAIISSHRVNFCGHIDPTNREKGIAALKILLKQIIKRWPDVEFMGAHELGHLIAFNK